MVYPSWLTVRRIERNVASEFPLPAVAVGEQLLLVVKQLLTGFGGELEIGSLDDGVDGACLLAQAAVDAFHHVDIIAGGAPRPIVPARARFDGDRLCRTDGLAKFAGDAALIAVGIAAERLTAGGQGGSEI